MNRFHEENNELLQHYLDRNYFKQDPDEDNYPAIEFMLTSDCDHRCKYCYLKKHEEKLYPKEIRDPELILKNAAIFLDYLAEKQCKFKPDIFSGELFSQELGFDFLELLYQHALRCPGSFKAITVPSNMSFIADEEKIRRVENEIKRFSEINITLHISASFDGKYLLENRPFIDGNEIRDEEYFEKLFHFVWKHRCGLHPMVSAFNIDKWKDNYQWFKNMAKKHNIIDPLTKEGIEPMMLVVRDDNWTEEAVSHLLDYLDYVINNKYEELGSDPAKFAEYLFRTHKDRHENITMPVHYGSGNKISCGIQHYLTVRMGDLTIVQCHRMAYDQFNAGRFMLEDDKITGVQAGNLGMFLTIKAALGQNLPQCENCVIHPVCMKGCLGSQYENTRDPFLPVESVCDMLKARTKHMLTRYMELGVMEQAFTFLPENEILVFQQIMEELGVPQ